MSTTITRGATVITPLAVEVWEDTSDAGNLAHDIIGRSEPDFTLRPGGSPYGTLSLVFETGAEALAARQAHRTGGAFTLISSDRPELDMTYITVGRVTRGLDQTAQAYWRLTVDYREVTP